MYFKYVFQILVFQILYNTGDSSLIKQPEAGAQKLTKLYDTECHRFLIGDTPNSHS